MTLTTIFLYIVLVKIMLCSTVLCQKYFKSKNISYQIENVHVQPDVLPNTHTVDYERFRTSKFCTPHTGGRNKLHPRHLGQEYTALVALRRLVQGLRVQGSGFRVQGTGCRVQGSGFRVQGSGRRVQGSGFRVQGAGSRIKGLGFRVWEVPH